MYDLKADYTVLLFWSHTCGTLQKHMPDYSIFTKNTKDKGVDVAPFAPNPNSTESKSSLKST
ncbi:MAG: hypothetical protein IPN94_27310, partial [Sphingobacteriales bacterium]|nr:hypothetical protein [Sphingobacteriales bacterium]